MIVALFGTPSFAVPTLEALANNPEFTLAAVVTQCDRPVGRKAVLTRAAGQSPRAGIGSSRSSDRKDQPGRVS